LQGKTDGCAKLLFNMDGFMLFPGYHLFVSCYSGGDSEKVTLIPCMFSKKKLLKATLCNSLFLAKNT